MSPLTHAAALSCVAVALALAHGWWARWPGPPKRVLPALALLVALPIPLLLVDDPAWSGKEGWLEAATEGLLLYGLGLGVARKNPWVIVGAALLLLEEVDYGQLFFDDWPTPALLAELGSRSTRLNSHNIPGLDGAWRWVPMIGLLVLSLWRRPRFGLPDLHRSTAVGLGLALALSAPTLWLAGGDAWNESFELALAALAVLGWAAARGAEEESP